MGPKGGGRKGFVKAAAATKVAEPPPVPDSLDHVGQVYRDPAQEANGKDGRARPAPAAPSVLSLPEPTPADGESRGQMLQRHKKETKQLKEAAKKAGKKHKEEADRLEVALEERQQAELTQRSLADFGVADAAPAAAADDAEQGDGKGPTRAQKRRDKAAAQQRQREQRIVQETEAAGESDKAAEQRQLEAILAPLGLCIREIAADGHCLYRAIDDQLQHPASSGHADRLLEGSEPARLDNGASGYQELRATAAGYMRAHAADFEPFVEQDSDEEEDAAPHEHFQRYCRDVEGTAAWGGDLELNALSRALKRHFVVHSAGLPAVELGTEHKGAGDTLHLCYLRHAFGLGEHYNSVQPLQAGTEDCQADEQPHEALEGS